MILRLKKYFETEEKFKTTKQTLWPHFSSIEYKFMSLLKESCKTTTELHLEVPEQTGEHKCKPHFSDFHL